MNAKFNNVLELSQKQAFIIPAAIGAAYGAASSPKGSRGEGALQGAGIGAGTGLGMNLGAYAGLVGAMIADGRGGGIGNILPLAGLVGGGMAGYHGSRAAFGKENLAWNRKPKKEAKKKKKKKSAPAGELKEKTALDQDLLVAILGKQAAEKKPKQMPVKQEICDVLEKTRKTSKEAGDETRRVISDSSSVDVKGPLGEGKATTLSKVMGPDKARQLLLRTNKVKSNWRKQQQDRQRKATVQTRAAEFKKQHGGKKLAPELQKRLQSL